MPDLLLCLENAEESNLPFVYYTIFATFHTPLLVNALVILNHWEVAKYSSLFSYFCLVPAAWYVLLPLNEFLVIHRTQLNNRLLFELS